MVAIVRLKSMAYTITLGAVMPLTINDDLLTQLGMSEMTDIHVLLCSWLNSVLMGGANDTSRMVLTTQGPFLVLAVDRRLVNLEMQ